jgi:drug/metabolite transporter (DMT)-like permease
MSSRAWALFLAMSLLWGMPYLLIKVAVAELDPTFLVFARLAVSAVVLLPLAVLRGSLRAARKSWLTLLTIAIGGIVLPFLLIAYGEQYIDSSLAALLIAADPLFIALLALWLDPTERSGGWRLVGLCLGFIGVGALLGLNLQGDTLGILGALMVLGAALCYAGSALLVKRASGVTPLGATSVSLAMAGVVLAPLAVLHVPAQMPSMAALGSLVALSVVCTALAYVIYFSLIGAAGATRAALITYVNPAVAVILGAIVLHEPITPGTIVGFALIIVGCALATYPRLGPATSRSVPLTPAGPTPIPTAASGSDLPGRQARVSPVRPPRP